MGSVSLHVMAKNAEKVIGRLIDNVGGHIRECHVVLNDTTDETLRVIGEMEGKFLDVLFKTYPVTSESNPELYLIDVAETYVRGQALAGEIFGGPFTGGPLLADWSGARSVGWGTSGCDWRLFLDADDVVRVPGQLRDLVLLAERSGADVVATKYVYGTTAGGLPTNVTYRERLARNTPSIRWEGSVHEVLTGALRRAVVEDGFTVVDLKDNDGVGVRAPGRCFKVLYREARMRGWRVSARHLAYLIQEALPVMPTEWVEGPLFAAYDLASESVEEAAWVACEVGEARERASDLEGAGRWYGLAMSRFPSSKAAFRMARISFLKGMWRDCLINYDIGKTWGAVRQILDLGGVYEAATNLLAVEAHYRLGELAEAKKCADKAVVDFPDDASVVELWKKVYGKD